jgi:hypothetical protein
MLEWRGVYWYALAKPAEGWYLHETTHGTACPSSLGSDLICFICLFLI